MCHCKNDTNQWKNTSGLWKDYFFYFNEDLKKLKLPDQILYKILKRRIFCLSHIYTLITHSYIQLLYCDRMTPRSQYNSIYQQRALHKKVKLLSKSLVKNSSMPKSNLVYSAHRCSFAKWCLLGPTLDWLELLMAHLACLGLWLTKGWLELIISEEFVLLYKSDRI